MSSVEQLLADLADRADALAGVTLAELARAVGIALPPDTRRHKGIIGVLVERALGARGGSHADVDFPELGVELKTIPIHADGRPAESTFVCTIDLDALAATPWSASLVRRKLAHVLFIPVEADPPLPARRLGRPIWFELGGTDEATLCADYELFAGHVGAAQVDRIDAHLGAALQIRPKGANAAEQTYAAHDGDSLTTVRRGFYLRSSFTAALIRRELQHRDPSSSRRPTTPVARMARE